MRNYLYIAFLVFYFLLANDSNAQQNHSTAWKTINEQTFKLSFKLPDLNYVKIDSVYLLYYVYVPQEDSSVSLQLIVAEDSSAFNNPEFSSLFSRCNSREDSLKIFVKMTLASVNGELISLQFIKKNKFTQGIEFGIKSNMPETNNDVFMFVRLYMNDKKILVATSSSDKKKLSKLLKNYKEQFLDSIKFSG